MRLTLLGTGSAMPEGHRFQAGYLVEADDRALLVDCGSGVIHRLAATTPGYEGVDTLLITHHHVDHIADVVPLLKARWLAGAAPLDVYGPPGTSTLIEGLLGIHEYLRGKVEVNVHDIEADVREVDEWSVRAMETRHTMPCLAYRLSSDAGDFTFSGDSEAMTELAAFAGGSSVFVHDCSFPDDIDVANHSTPAQLGAALSGAEIDRVILSHLYPHTSGRHEEMLESIGERYDGRVEILSDLETIEC